MNREHINLLLQKNQIRSLQDVPEMIAKIRNSMLIDGTYTDANGKKHAVHEKGLAKRLVKELYHAVSTFNYEDVYPLRALLYELKSHRDIATEGHIPLREAIITSAELKEKHYKELTNCQMLANNRIDSSKTVDDLATIIYKENGLVSNIQKKQWATTCKRSGGTKIPHFSPLVNGAPGTGKTNFITYLSKQLGVNFKGISAAHMDETTFGLFPLPAVKGEEVQKTPETDIKSLITKQGIFLIDELLRGTKRVLQTLITVISEHKIGPFSIHGGTTIVFATNDANSDSSIVNEIAEATRDRLQVIDMPTDPLAITASWLNFVQGEYGELTNMSPLREIIGFITENPERIYQIATVKNEAGVPLPATTMRGWTYVVELLSSLPEKDNHMHIKENIAFQLGTQMASEFEAYKITNEGLPTVNELLKRSTNAHLVPVIASVGATFEVNSKEKIKKTGKLISVLKLPNEVMYRFGSPVDDRSIAQKEFDKEYEAKLLSMFKDQMIVKRAEAKSAYTNRGMSPSNEEIERCALHLINKEVTLYLGSDAQERLAMKKENKNALAIYENANPKNPHKLVQSENSKWSNPSPSIIWWDQPELLPNLESKEKFIKFMEDTLNTIYTADMIPKNQEELKFSSVLSLGQSIYSAMCSHINSNFEAKTPVQESVLKNLYKLVCTLPEITVKDNIMSRINNEIFNCQNPKWVDGFKNYGIELETIEAGKVVDRSVELIPDIEHISAKAFRIMLQSVIKNPKIKDTIITRRGLDTDYSKSKTKKNNSPQQTDDAPTI